MLNQVFNIAKLKHRKFIALHLFISFFTFQPLAFALNDSELAEKYRLQGYEHQQRGDYNEALSYYTKAISVGLDNPEVYNDMGILYEKVGFNNRAESFYIQAIKIDRQFLPAYMNLAYLYSKLRRKDLAVKYFKQRYELGNHEDPWTEKAKEELLKIEPKYQSWIDGLEAERLNQELVKQAQEAFYKRVEQSKEMHKKGVDYFNQAKYEQAIKEFDKALYLMPDSKETTNARKRAVIELSKQKVKQRSDEAIEMLNSGNSVSARNEIQRILTEIPDEPIIISE